MEGLTQSKPLRKMGLHSSPTGELFLDDVRVGTDRLLGQSEDAFRGAGGRSASKATFSIERAGVAAMALGIVERCLELSVAYANDRVQFGRPIGEFQLIQLKLAKMEVARLNIQNRRSGSSRWVPPARTWTSPRHRRPSCTRRRPPPRWRWRRCSSLVATAICRSIRWSSWCDAKVLQIYAGTDEIQISQIARDLLAQA